MSVKAFEILLRREKKTLATVKMKKGDAPILVGRARDCTLRIPSDDASASGVHAKLYWRGGALMIEDAGSRNGIFCDGILLKRARRVQSGDLYAVGNCLLCVKVEEKAKKQKTLPFHRLEFMNGAHAGRIVDVRPHADGKEFDFGLDPKSSVHLNDLLVSRRHAVMREHEDGECWIEDLESRNGTFVNGERLSGKERLLKDGDKISVAYFDFRFLDRRVAHTRVQAWLKLGVVSVTLCVMAVGYVAWTASRQSASNYLANARKAAAVEDFATARTAAEGARMARDASDMREQIDSLLRQIGTWETTCRLWKDVQADFAANRLKKALQSLEEALSGTIEAWAWNPSEAADRRADAVFADQALRYYFNGREAIAAAGTEAKADVDLQVRATIGPIESFVRKHGDSAKRRPYLAPVLKTINELLGELRFIREGYDAVDGNIARISVTNLDFHGVYETFGRVAADTRLPVAVRGYARSQLVICRQFVVAQDFLEGELDKITRLDFSGARAAAGDFKLPSPEMCIRHVKYSDSRAALAARHEQYQQEASALQMMADGLESAGITLDSRGEDIDLFLNVTNVNEALSFDCFRRKPPSARRPGPVGMYDTLFGIEYTHEALRSLPNAVNGRNLRTVGFLPKCMAARQAFDRAETFVTYLDADERKYLQRGDIGRFYTQCVRITIERERLAQRLRDVKGPARKEIVAGFYADFFSSHPTDVAKRTLSQRFTVLKREIATLCENYQFETDPGKQLKIRDEILAKGIPGDPAIHPKWAQKFD